ncbi:MAG: hypothetical protein ABGW90_05640 [Martelella sp.]
MTFKLLLAAACLVASSAAAEPANFIYSGDADEATLTRLLQRPDIEGFQQIYSWRQLEPGEGVYDFSEIEADLARTEALGKQFFIQIQDRFFSNEARRLPDYILTDPIYDSGLVAQMDGNGEELPLQQGWAAIQWNDALRTRFQALLTALAEEFDGRIAGINLPETAIDIDMKADATGFSCDAYVDAELDNLRHARSVFTESDVVQYVNFWPCEWNNDHGYMERLFEMAAAEGIGLGGPDIAPYRKGQMKNAYPFFHDYRDRLPVVAMAIQEPTLKYKNDKTGKPYTRAEFVDFAENYLGVDIIFWTPEAPWLSKN